MNKSLRRQFLEANLQQIESFLGDPALRPLERIGFEDRRDDIMEDLQRLGRGTSANVIVSFDGDPVADAPGIDTKFAGKALAEFQDFVSIIDASKINRVRDTGKIPRKSASSLRLVGLVNASFGFELQEADNPMFTSSLADSVRSATKLIAAAGQGDDEFIDAVEDSDARVQTKLRDFLEVVKNAHAVCKVTADDVQAILGNGCPNSKAPTPLSKTTHLILPEDA